MFDINEFLAAENNTHQFTTDNVYFNQIGLGTFTTGTLYAYFNARGKDGNYANRGVITEADGFPILFAGQLFGVRDGEDNDNWGTWEGWRKSEFTGVWEKKKWNEWDLTEQGMTSTYTYDQFASEFIDFSYIPALRGSTALNKNPSRAELVDGGFNIKYVPLKVQKDSQDDISKAIADHYFLYGGSLNPLINIINMNDFMIDVKRKKPRRGDNGWRTLTGGVFNKNNLFAMEEYLNDIKSSKSKSIKVSGELTFNLKMANERFQCPKTEWVTFNLSLFDAPPRQAPRAKAVLKDLNMAYVKRDATGRKYLSRSDGDTTPADDNNNGHKTVAEMKLSYNPYLDKWESGTTSIVAKVVTPVARAVYNPAITVLENADIAANLADGSEELHFAPSSGLAMPVQMQNGNPFQYAPNYAKTADCRAEDKTKQKVTCFNFNPKKSFKIDDMVMLSQIDGIWHMISLDEDLDIEEPVEPSFAGQWEFQQFITNTEHFFIDKTTNSKVEPEVVEKSFHKKYYADDLKNGGTPAGVPRVTDGRTYSDGFSTSGIPIVSASGGNVLQIDSFDFVDEQLFGFRKKNAIGSILGAEDAAGRNIHSDYNREQGGWTGMYFGCAFPDGYTDTSVAELGRGKTWNVRYQNSGALTPNTQGLFDESIIPDLGYYSFGGNIESDIVNSGIDPFEEEQNILLDGNNKIISYAPARSDMQSVSVLFPDEEPTEERNTQPENFRKGQHEVSMLYQYNRAVDRKLKHLPADIALNASPTDKYGGPMHNLHRLDRFYNDSVHTENLRYEVKKALASATWLVKQSGQYDPTTHDPNNSAMALEPNTPGRIQFRPLKTDLCWSYNSDIGPNYGKAWQASGSLVYNETEKASDRGEAFSAAKGWATFLSAEAPYAFRLKSINPAAAAHAVQHRLRYDLGLSDLTLLKRTLYDNTDQALSGKRIGFNKYITPFGYGGRLHNGYFFSNQYMGWLNDDLGHGTQGVIGAVTTVAVNDKINFVTEQIFGMYSYSQSRFTGGGTQAGFFGGVPVLGGFGSVSNIGTLTDIERPSWGGSSKDYNDVNTIDLSVTVYHAHPRTQTIYDPKFFCVHHFNDRPDLQGYYTNPASWYTRYLEDNIGKQLKNSGEAVLVDNTGNEFKYAYHIDPTQAQIGIREPSVWSGTEHTLPVPLAQNVDIMKDGADLRNEDEDPFTPLLPQGNWHLNITRFGKLLPYSYKYFTVAGPFASGEAAPLRPILEDSNYGAAKNNKDTIFYKSLGSNAQVGDVIGNLQNNVYFSVQSVVLDADDDNKVTDMTLQCFSTGENISTGGFARSTDIVDAQYGGGIKLKNIAGLGSGFEGYFLNGKVIVKDGEDLKPKAVAREQQLSLPADNTQESQVVGGINPNFGKVQGQKENELFIASEDRSADKKYDCFFHFHNDTSFTWGRTGGTATGPAIGWADAINPYDVFEQYIELNITGS